jgi:hypothetical protein
MLRRCKFEPSKPLDLRDVMDTIVPHEIERRPRNPQVHIEALELVAVAATTDLDQRSAEHVVLVENGVDRDRNTGEAANYRMLQAARQLLL